MEVFTFDAAYEKMDQMLTEMLECKLAAVG
jgi:hypothetical protein